VKRTLLAWLSVFIFHAGFAQNADIRILQEINRNSYPRWDYAMLNTSQSVYIVMPVSVLVIGTHGLLQKEGTKYREGIKAIAGIALSAGVTTLTKYMVNRKRPVVQYPDKITARDVAGPYSFPSAHTSSAFATATCLSLSFNKWYVTAPAYLYAGMVAYSRMRLGMHFPTDVLGGMVIGAGMPYLVYRIDKYLVKRKTIPEKKVEP
jgi:membrane-associated phospholipid phosphatase